VVALSGNDFNKLEFAGMPSDTLFKAERIYLQFNIIEIIKQDYRLRKIHALNGSFTILVDSKGGVNYRIFKEKENNIDTGNLTVGLDGVKLTNFSWQFLNISKDIFSEGLIKNIAFKGRFSQNNFSLNTLASLYIETFKREDIEYASNLNLASQIIMEVNDSIYTISKGELILNDLIFKAGGTLIAGTKTILDFQVAGEKLNISSLISILPINTLKIKKHSPSGKADILAKINGQISSTHAPSIKAAFKISDAKILLAENGKFINGIAINGSYSNGSKRNAFTSRINFNSYSVHYGENQLSGKLSLDNFRNPFLSASLKGTIIAKDLSDALALEGWNLQEGIIQPDLSVNMNLSSTFKFVIQNIGIFRENLKLV
jgi:hypothetical protein